MPNEGKTNVPAEYASPQADARLSRQNELEEWPFGAQTAPCKGSKAPDRQQRVTSRFRPAERIRRRAEFQQVYDRGTRLHSRFFTIFFLPNQQGAGRLGVAATKKLGGSVQRNRAKRLIREVFRRNKVAPGFDVVVIPKRDLLEASLITLEADYRTLVERRLRRSAPPVHTGSSRAGGS